MTDRPSTQPPPLPGALNPAVPAAPRLQVVPCLTRAAKAFTGWWIPLCLVAAALVGSQKWLPEKLLGEDYRMAMSYRDVWHSLSSAASDETAQASPLDRLLALHEEMLERPAPLLAAQRLAFKTLAAVGSVFLLVCFLHTLLIILSRASVQTHKAHRRIRENSRRSPILTLSYIVLAFIKLMPFFAGGLVGVLLAVGLWLVVRGPLLPVLVLLEFGLCMLPAAYLYVRLFFTGFVITEESAHPIPAIGRSWQLTRGQLLPLACLFAAEVLITLLGLVTLFIAYIPGTAFKYTLRASAYEQLRALRVTGGG